MLKGWHTLLLSKTLYCFMIFQKLLPTECTYKRFFYETQTHFLIFGHLTAYVDFCQCKNFEIIRLWPTHRPPPIRVYVVYAHAHIQSCLYTVICEDVFRNLRSEIVAKILGEKFCGHNCSLSKGFQISEVVSCRNRVYA